MAGMEINLGFAGLTEAVNRLREMERLTSQIARNQAGGGGGGGGAAAGPMARLGAARGGLSSALASGEPSAIFDAQVRAIRAEQSVARAQRLLGGSTVGSRLMTAVSTSRFGAGGVMPLVGRTAAVLGGEAMAGPIGAAVAGAAAAISAFSTIMHDATQSVGEFRRAATVTGGTAGQTAQLAAMGVAPGQQGQFAANLRERLVTDSRAMAAAQRIGVPLPSHRLAGTVNEAQLAIQVLDRLRNIRDPTRQLLEARELDVESQLDVIRVSDRLWRARKADAQVADTIMAGTAATFRELEGQSARAATSFDNLKAALGGMAAPTVGAAAGAGADITNLAARLLGSQTAQTAAEQTLRTMPVIGPLRGISELIQGIFHGFGGGQSDAIQKNTEAMEANTQMIQQGMVGGGPHGAGAVPSALRGRALAEALETQRIKLGVFGN